MLRTAPTNASMLEAIESNNVNKSNVTRVEEGPLVKNTYTRKLEQAIQEIIADFDAVKLKRSKGKILILINDEFYDLEELLESANFSHIILEDEDFDNLFQLYKNHHGISEKTIKDVDHDTSEHYFSISTLPVFKNGEGSAKQKLMDGSIELYTKPDYYGMINGIMRGQFKSIVGEGEIHNGIAARIKLSLIHAGVICQSIRENLQRHKHLTRTEYTKNLPKTEVKAREDNIAGIIPCVPTSAFTSSSMRDRHIEDAEVKIHIDVGLGTDISEKSYLPHEDEFLMAPVQLQYYRKAIQDGKTEYYARVVMTPEGLTLKQRDKIKPKPVKSLMGCC